MYCVFYMVIVDGTLTPNAETCATLEETLKRCEMARQAGHSFVTIGVENPNMTGKLGVEAPKADYYWHKRRT